MVYWMTKKTIRPLFSCVALLIALAAALLLLQEADRRYRESVYPLSYRDAIDAVCEEYAVSPSLVYAVIHTESMFDSNAVSSADAKGLMQLTDDTYRWALQRMDAEEQYRPEILFDPEENIRLGVYVLSLLSEQFTNTDTLLAAYNAGQGHVKEWLADPSCSTDGVTLITIPFEETKEYIQRVNEAREQYQALYQLQ